MSNLRDFFDTTTYDVVDGIKLDGTGGYALSVSGEFDVNKWVEGSDTIYSLNNMSWGQLTDGPSGNMYARGIYYLSSNNNYIIECGGNTNGTMWRFVIGDNLWIEISDMPVALSNHSAIHYTANLNGNIMEYMIVHGGIDTSVNNYTNQKATWRYDIINDAWAQLADGPTERYAHSAVYYTDGTNDYMIIHGGVHLNDTWAYNITDDTWTQLANGPDDRSAHSAVYYNDGVNNLMIIYGGVDEGDYLNDTWEYNIDTDTWRELAVGPLGRTYASMGFFSNANGKYIILYGGIETNAAFNEIWVFDIINNEWTKLPNAPIGRYAAAFAFYTIGDNTYMLVHGGHNGDVYLKDTMIYNINTGIELKDAKIILPKRA